MKKIYIEAELEVINLLNADIITASGNTGNDVSGGPSEGDNIFDMGGSW